MPDLLPRALFPPTGAFDEQTHFASGLALIAFIAFIGLLAFFIVVLVQGYLDPIWLQMQWSTILQNFNQRATPPPIGTTKIKSGMCGHAFYNPGSKQCPSKAPTYNMQTKHGKHRSKEQAVPHASTHIQYANKTGKHRSQELTVPRHRKH